MANIAKTMSDILNKIRNISDIYYKFKILEFVDYLGNLVI